VIGLENNLMAFVEGVFPFSSREIVVYRKISGERQKRRNVSHTTYPSESRPGVAGGCMNTTGPR
jgi:hypothetical protein